MSPLMPSRQAPLAQPPRPTRRPHMHTALATTPLSAKLTLIPVLTARLLRKRRWDRHGNRSWSVIKRGAGREKSAADSKVAWDNQSSPHAITNATPDIGTSPRRSKNVELLSQFDFAHVLASFYHHTFQQQCISINNLYDSICLRAGSIADRRSVTRAAAWHPHARLVNGGSASVKCGCACMLHLAFAW